MTFGTLQTTFCMAKVYKLCKVFSHVLKSLWCIYEGGWRQKNSAQILLPVQGHPFPIVATAKAIEFAGFESAACLG
jgi:hypothetical protein